MTVEAARPGAGRRVGWAYGTASVNCMKEIGTVALLISFRAGQPVLLDALSDDDEVKMLERAIERGSEDPIGQVYEHRTKAAEEDEAFGDYVEDLLSRPFLKPEIQKHGVQWLRSKLKIEHYQQSEAEATRVIAAYAFQVFMEDPAKTDFVLAGPRAKVRIRVFTLDCEVRRAS